MVRKEKFTKILFQFEIKTTFLDFLKPHNYDCAV